ncbi:ARM repeat-containing protein [Viridothelium virens]|uniref:ARM repeat-containing protein n=1 Tax=Viridothelium virens TaxID=1048519 RepID=A0A6A6HC39_VIRVR|nr:ARM repeat-containing protein [Viridothelium virens]
MGSNGHTEAFAPVLAALTTMQSNVDRAQKGKAHEYLENFQKSTDAWTTTFSILHSTDAPVEAKLFAATTLKGKIVFDLHQLPSETIARLRDSLLSLLSQYRAGPKPIRTQLCVCLANLAIQMTEWKNVLQLVVSTLGTDSQSIASVLEFLHVLPEEVTEGRKINLTEDELVSRTQELLEENADQVVSLLTQYSQSSATAAKDPQLLECITSWLKEVPLNDIVNGPLLNTIIDSLSEDGPFECGVDCLCAMFRETREVDECLSVIQTLYPRIVSLKPRLAVAAEEEDTDTFRGLTRIFAEAGESWVVLIARMPEQFQTLVEAILESAARDKERDAISMTFNFWYEFKQYLTLDKYMQSRLQYVDTYSKLVDVMMVQLEYPKPESANQKDLFDGDRDAEEKFRYFRHQMGDVLKDCTEVIGTTECLAKAFKALESWLNAHASQSSAGQIPEWQKLEAALFSFRALGRMIPPDEQIILPQLMPLIVQIPDHEKVRFQAVMALGRYTEWTANHPETLQPQFNYITTAFDHRSREVVKAAALSMRFFCQDCASLLKDFTAQLQQFYDNVLDRLPMQSQEELTEGIAAVVAAQPVEHTYEILKLFCDPLMKRFMTMAQSATTKKQTELLADSIQLLTIFIQWVQIQVPEGQQHPAVKYCQEIFPILSTILDNFPQSSPIQERICRCWRYMVLSYRTAIAPLLPQLADKLAAGFTDSRQGCFLWASDAIVREFSEDKGRIDQGTLDAIFNFYQQQATTFLRILNDLPPEELPDIIEDFFRLALDVFDFYPTRALPSSLTPSILSASCTALTLLSQEPLMATLHFLRDFLMYGGPDPPVSTYPAFDENDSTTTSADGSSLPRSNPPELQHAVRSLLQSNGIGESLVQRCLTGMMYSFPAGCIPDASGVLLALFQMLPTDSAAWTAGTIALLPQGSVSEPERERLSRNIGQRIQSGEVRKVRTLLQDFCAGFRRRNVAPREGLGRLEGGRFRFAG